MSYAKGLAVAIFVCGVGLGMVVSGYLPVHAQEVEPDAAEWRNKPREERIAIVQARKAAASIAKFRSLPDGVTVFDGGDGVRCYLYQRDMVATRNQQVRLASLSCVRMAP